MHFLSLLDISVRYQVLCLFLSRSPLLDQLLSFLYKIAYFVKNDMSYNFRWHREHGNGKFSLLSSKFSSSTVLQNIKWYFFKFGYILQYKLFKMQIFCLDIWRHFFLSVEKNGPTSSEVITIVSVDWCYEMSFLFFCLARIIRSVDFYALEMS